MAREVPFSSFTRELNVHLDTLSYNELIPPIEHDAQGNEVVPRRESFRVGSGEIYRLLEPYLSSRFNEQLRAVFPLAAYLALFQLFILVISLLNSVHSAGLSSPLFISIKYSYPLKLIIPSSSALVGADGNSFINLKES